MKAKMRILDRTIQPMIRMVLIGRGDRKSAYPSADLATRVADIADRLSILYDLVDTRAGSDSALARHDASMRASVAGDRRGRRSRRTVPPAPTYHMRRWTNPLRGSSVI